MENSYDKNKKALHFDAMMQRNEMQSNNLLISICFGMSIALIFMAMFAILFSTDVINKYATAALIGGTALIGFAICFVCKFCLKNPHSIMYISMTGLIFVCAVLNLSISYYVYLLIVFPVLISCRYFSWKFTLKVGILTLILSYLVATIHACFRIGIIDLNIVMLARQVIIPESADLYQVVLDSGNVDWESYTEVYLGSFQLFKSLFFILISCICTVIAAKGRQMMAEQSEITENIMKMDFEMQMAGRIQKSLVTHEANDNHDDKNRFFISASMTPAKEVGGDFYDYFMPDDNHLVITIADVSGKGISAALFAVKARTLIREEAKSSLNPVEIVSVVNKNLCENNTEELFVTAWLAVIDLNSGVVNYVNAGHNPPMIMTASKGYYYLKDEHNMFLGTIETIEYLPSSFKLCQGERILLYTDGVTEAAKETGEMYGEQRFLNLVNSNQLLDGNETIATLREDIELFSDGFEQSDDITILLCCYHGC